MQFIPSTWQGYAADGNGDGSASPHNVYDATLAAGKYLCSGNLDLSNPQDRATAVFRYNHSDSYVRTVLIWADAYAKGVDPLPQDPVDYGDYDDPNGPGGVALGPPSQPNLPGAPGTTTPPPVTSTSNSPTPTVPSTKTPPSCTPVPTTDPTTTDPTSTTTTPPPPSSTDTSPTSSTHHHDDDHHDHHPADDHAVRALLSAGRRGRSVVRRTCACRRPRGGRRR